MIFISLSSDILPHQIRLWRSGKDVFIPGHQQSGYVDRLQVRGGIRTLSHASLHLGHIFGRHFSHHAERAVNQVRTALPCGFTHQFGNHTLKKRLGTAFQNIGGGLQAASPGIGGIGWRFGVEQSQGSDPSTIPAPELEQHIAADGNSGERHPPKFRVVENSGDIRGMLFHGGGAFADAGFSVTAQVGKDQLIARSQRLSSGQPEFMMDGKGCSSTTGAPVPTVWYAISASPLLM